GLLRAGDETVVVDEALHGFASAATVWREILRFPLVFVPVHLALVACLLLLATVTRFGSPAAAPEGWRAGKRDLLDITAALLQYGGNSTHTLRRYFTRTLQDVQRALHEREGLEPAALIASLQAASKARGVRVDLQTLEGEVQEVASEAATLAAAGRIYQ